MADHQQHQLEVINAIEKQINNSLLQFSTVSPVEDYERDPRICLTGVHIPSHMLKDKVRDSLIKPLKALAPEYYYYSFDSLHMTIKNVRVIDNPPHFTDDDIAKAEKVFSKVIPNHKKFKVYFYRLLLFPNNLALIGTTDQELDEIVLDLDQKLNDADLPDDKKYTNKRYFFSNMTLARFPIVSDKFKQKVQELSSSLSFDPYTVDSVTLLTCNAVFKKRHIVKTWKLA